MLIYQQVFKNRLEIYRKDNNILKCRTNSLHLCFFPCINRLDIVQLVELFQFTLEKIVEKRVKSLNI